MELDELIKIMAALRGEKGVPDREQTMESLKPFIVEETYEVPRLLTGRTRRM
jgi:uncharacterized protein YabN with tetrapyrrole methylase and pyrophosphatase domain